MSKLFLTSFLFLLVVNGAWATDGFSVHTLTIPQGGSSELEIIFSSETSMYNRFQLEVQMPDGITYVQDLNGDVMCGKGPLIASTNHTISASHISSLGLERFICVSMTNKLIPAGQDVIMTVTYQADMSLPVGTELNGVIKNILWNDADNAEYTMDDINFTIVVGEPSDGRTVLDETSTTLPDDASGVDVRVLRTIKANEWSTIVLPFAMDNTQLKAAFGDDVQLADFTSWESEEDDDTGDIINIRLGFTDVTEIEANHPYIIKVSDAISEFTVDDVDIEVEDEPTVQVGKKKAERGYFIGTYVAKTPVPEDDLFISGNNFWYSAGLTKMKAFRGYFELADVLSEQEVSSAKVMMFVGDKATVIDGTEMNIQGMAQGVYSIQGTFLGKEVDVNQLPDGLYIIDGKKVSIKK